MTNKSQVQKTQAGELTLECCGRQGGWYAGKQSNIKMALTHLNEQGKASMVDVSAKAVVNREAVAEGFIRLQPQTMELIRQNEIKKGDVLAVARIAGIQAAKQTATLIPLCHQLPLSKVGVDFRLEQDGVMATSIAKTSWQTGVEMEALTAVSVALLTIYDMCKAVDSSMSIEGVKLLKKTKEAS